MSITPSVQFRKRDEKKRVLSLERHTIVSLRMQLPMREIFRTDDCRTNLCTQRNVDSVEQTHYIVPHHGKFTCFCLKHTYTHRDSLET
jgi:hypothetical protein